MSDRETLYHASIGLPKWFRKPTQSVALRWTYHATVAAQEDRYGIIPRFKTLTLARFEVIEIGVIGTRVSKILFRGTLNETDDVCIVLIPGRDFWTVKTVWINKKSDTHKTLDAAKYENV